MEFQITLKQDDHGYWTSRWKHDNLPFEYQNMHSSAATPEASVIQLIKAANDPMVAIAKRRTDAIAEYITLKEGN